MQVRLKMAEREFRDKQSESSNLAESTNPHLAMDAQHALRQAEMAVDNARLDLKAAKNEVHNSPPHFGAKCWARSHAYKQQLFPRGLDQQPLACTSGSNWSIHAQHGTNGQRV